MNKKYVLLSLLTAGLMIAGCKQETEVDEKPVVRAASRPAFAKEPPVETRPATQTAATAPGENPANPDLAGPPLPPPTTGSATQSASPTVKMDSGLEYQDLVIGSGEDAQAGKSVRVHYTGWLTNGKVFDSSRRRNEPFTFVLGQHQVIAGWDEGVKGMKVGGKRKLIIPPALGYGSSPTGQIPPNSTLIFEVELLGVGK